MGCLKQTCTVTNAYADDAQMATNYPLVGLKRIGSNNEEVSASEFVSGALRDFETLSLRLFSQQNPGETH
jgi:hypothetical protein